MGYDSTERLVQSLRLQLRRLGLTELPTEYVTFQFATSGLDPHEDVLLDLAVERYRTGEVKDAQSWLLDWSSAMSHPELERLDFRIQETGRNIRNHVDWPYAEPGITKKVPAQQGCEDFAAALQMALQHGLPLFTAGGFMFGASFFTASVVPDFLRNTYEAIPEDRLWDVAAFEKGSVLSRLPHTDETLLAYAVRMYGERGQVKHSIRHLFREVYRLGEPCGRHGKAVWDAVAGADAVAGVVEAWRGLLAREK